MNSQLFELIRTTSIAANYCQYFHAGDNYRYFYPFRLQRPEKATWDRRELCTQYILDSGIGDDDMTNRKLLDLADELEATYVVPKDYIGDQDKTTASVREFLDLYDEHPCAATPIIPLQPPHAAHQEVLDGHGAYALGGIKDESASQQLAYARDFRGEVGYDIHLHGFGFGPTQEFIEAVREEPRLLDSVDSSTLETNLKFDKIQDSAHTVHEFNMPTGERTSAVYGAYVSASLMLINYMLTPLCDEYEVRQVTSALEW